MQQANLDLAYQDFLRQQQYPMEQVKFLADIASGVRLPQTSVTTSTDMPAMPGDESKFEKLVKGAGGVEGLLEMFRKYFPSKKP